MKRKLLSLMLVLSMLSSLLFALPQVAEANDLNILDDGGVNISASISANSSYPASKMIDGDSGTYYQSQKGLFYADRTDLTIKITLPSAQTISGIQIHEKIPTGTPCTKNAVTVKFGTSSSNTELITTGYLKYPGAHNTDAATYFDFGGDYTGTYLEINFKYSYSKNSSYSQYEIYEIEAYRAVDYGVIMYDGSPRAKVGGALSLIDESDESVTPRVSRGVFMAPAAFLADSLGLSFTQSASGVEFAYNGKSSLLTSGDGIYSENGNIYVPAATVCEDLGISYESEACGLFFAGAEKAIDWNDKKELLTVGRHLRDVVYETAPTPAAVIAQLKANNPSNKHPRLFFSDDMTVDVLRERINHPPYAAWKKTIISNADRYLERMTKDPIEYEISGGRLIDVCERVLEDVENIGFAYLMTGDTKYSDKVVDAVVTVCGFPNWNPHHFLDVGHMAAAVALGYDWCYDKFSAEQKVTVRNALINYALKPVMEDYNEVSTRSRSFKWSEKATDAYPNNWIAICTGGTIMAALAIGDEDLGGFTDAGTVVTEGMKRFKDLADTYLPDGGFLDGPQYWEFAMNFIGNCVASMRSALGTDYGLSKSPGFNVTFDWQSQIEGSMGAFNFDSATDLFVNSPEFILFGELTGKEYLINHRVNHQLFYTNTAAPTFKDILWYDGGDYSNSQLPLDYHSRGATNVSVLRSGTDASDTWIAMYGGYRKKATDAMQDFDGTFVFDMNGKRWALDYGAESQTYSSSDYNFTDYYICRPEGHNTVIISESADSGHDSKACGYLIKSLSNDRMGMAVYDLTDQLDDYGATGWTRGIKLDRGLNKITVQDELTTTSSKPFYWFMHTEAAIEITDGGKGAILTLGEDKVKASLVTSDSSLKFEVREPNPLFTYPTTPPNQASREGTRKLTVHSSSVTSVNMAVEFVPYSDGDTVTTENFTPMSSWTLKGNGVFVKDSYSDESGEGEYATGATVTVDAGKRADAKFAGWVAEGIDLADPSNPTQTFTMPSGSVWLTAKWINTSFFDINFDNWTAYTDLKNADGTSSGSRWNSAVSGAGAVVETDSLRTSKGLKLTMNSSVSNYVTLTNSMNSDYQAFPTDKVIWAEFSVKFEGGFTAVGYDHDRGVSPICISADGAVRRFDENARASSSAKGDKPDMYQLELGKWYHIVWAMDCSKAPKGDGGLLYVWVNGKKILNGTDYSSAFKTAQDGEEHFKYYRMYVEKPSGGTSTVYLDNLKGYATYELDNHASEDFVISYPQDGYFEENGMLCIAGGKKAAEIAQDFSPRGVAITRDGNLLASDATVVSGDIINITATNGIGFWSYEAAIDGESSDIEEIVKSYIADDMEGSSTVFDGHGVRAYPEDEVFNNSRVAMYQKDPGNDLTGERLIKGLPNTLKETGVLWTEYTIRFHNNFTRFNFEHYQASPALWINDDGSLWTGGQDVHNRSGSNFGTPLDYTLKLDKRYHLVTALDYTNNDNGELTIWVNGEKIVDARTPDSNLKGNQGFEYVDLRIAPILDETPVSYVYIDNFYVYSTAKIDSHPELTNISDANSSDAISLEGNSIIAPAGTTVSEVKAALANSEQLIFANGGNLLGDSDTLEGADIYAPLTNGKGFRCYTLLAEGDNVPDEPDNPAVKIKDYIDINFDNWTGGTDGMASNGSAIKMDWDGCKDALSIVADSERGGKVLKANVAKESDGSPYFVKTRMRSGELPSNYANCKVLWNEFSIKYEGGFVGFGFGENNGAYNLISINKDGQLELGARWGYGEVGGTQFNRGVEVLGSQLEVGRWYDIAIAIDFANATDAGSPTYVLVNGDVIADGIINPNVKPAYEWVYHKLWLDTAQEAACTAYIDDLKVYETDILVLPERANVMTQALNSITANISTRDEAHHAITKMADGSKLGDDMYKSLKTDAEQEGLKVVAALDGVYRISSVTVTERYMGDQNLTVTVEIGKNGKLTKVVDKGTVNRGEGGAATETTYGFIAAEGDTIVYTFNAATHRPDESDYQIWELEAMGSYVGDVDKTALIPEIGFWYHNSKDAINTYYINCNNAGDEEVSGKFFIAAYKDDELVKIIDAKDVTLKKGANTICCTETDEIYDPTWTYKAFIWDGSDDATPIVASVDIIK